MTKFTQVQPVILCVGYGTRLWSVSLIGKESFFQQSEIGFPRKMALNTTKPDGTPLKLLDVPRMEILGWSHKADLKAGVQLTYEAFRSLSL